MMAKTENWKQQQNLIKCHVGWERESNLNQEQQK